MKRKSGFTLIELLVVIAIIAILAAILFPVFGTVKERAHLSACTSNMRQIGTAIDLYRNENHSFMPQAANIWYIEDMISDNAAAEIQRWHYMQNLSKYSKSIGVFICPGKPITHIRQNLSTLWKWKNGIWHGASYTPAMWPIEKGRMGPRSLAQVVWSQCGVSWSKEGLVNLDSLNYASPRNTEDGGGGYLCRQSEAVILFCLSGTWTASPTDSTRPPDSIWRGSHQRGTPALFADLHVNFANYYQVGWL